MNTTVPPSHTSVVVRSLLEVTPEQREKVLEDVEYNIFAFPAGLLSCDYLSDSGTSAMTDVQWASLMRGDESYGRNWGYYCLLDAFRDIFERGNDHAQVFRRVVTGMLDSDFYREELLKPHQGGFVNGGTYQLQRPNFFITPQGRCAESLLFSILSGMCAEISQGQDTPIIISNGFFDTTGANAAVAGFELQTFTQPGLSDPFPQHLVGKANHFKGNMDVAAVEAYINNHPGRTKMILATITNNWAAGQPVSMENIRKTAALAEAKEIPFFFDACRFAENAMFIHKYEEGYSDKSIHEIVQEMFSYVDGFTISLKKDGLSNMGGVLCIRDEGLLTQQYRGIGIRLKERQILTYGNDSYGGMSGRDLMTASAGLYEVTKASYLRSRIGQVQRFAERLQASGIAVLSPPGGHAVYLDMGDFFSGCDRDPGDFASVGFTIELIRRYGIRAAESGPFGWEWDKKSPEEQQKIPNLVRFALPRHVLSNDHIEYTVMAIKSVYDRRHTIPNVVITRGKDMRLRHFSSGLKPVPVNLEPSGTYVEAASKQLTHISRSIQQEPRLREDLLTALSLAAGQAGQQPVSRPQGPHVWTSDVSCDNTFFEYSVALDQKTGNAELRFLIEAQSQSSTLSSMQESALRLNADIENAYISTASGARLSELKSLFFPENAEGNFAAWHSCAASQHGPEWKIYLNPRAASASPDGLFVTREAFRKLKMIKALALLDTIMDHTSSVLYFSLDLSPDPAHSRVKVYIAHPDATASQIAEKHARICPDASAYEIQKFCEYMAGGTLGPYRSKPLLSCFAFTSEASHHPVGTIHFPTVAYANDDAEIQARIEKYMDAASVSLVYRERYRKSVRAVQRRPLSDGRGLHSWVSLKQGPEGKKTNNFYLSAELYGPLKPSRGVVD